jgi:outer membrane biosynthesis protein TonB
VSVSEAEVQAQPSLAVLVVRALGVAALVVGVSAALFWTIGRGGDDGLVVADGPDDEVSAEDDTTEEEPSGEEAEPEPEPPAEPDPEPEPDGAEDPDEGSEEPEEPEEPAEPEEPEEPSADRIDPSTVSVQVLDGYQADGGAAAAAVADELAAAGYRIIARNPAIAYDVTTVLWTAGSQAAGEQVARDIGAAEVRQQPGNLAESVMVHVVIGADRG